LRDLRNEQRQCNTTDLPKLLAKIGQSDG